MQVRLVGISSLPSHFVVDDEPAFVAPELLNNQDYGLDVDIYSFGMLVYEIVTLKEPFSEQSSLMIPNLVRSA